MTKAVKKSFRIHVDGGARGNPGPAAAGVVIAAADDGVVLFQGGFYLGRATNNVAEYQGLLAALKKAAELGAEEVEVISDSELMVRQMNGQYRVKNEGLKPLYEQAQSLRSRFKKFAITNVRRAANKAADKLVNQALNVQANVEDAAGA